MQNLLTSTSIIRAMLDVESTDTDATKHIDKLVAAASNRIEEYTDRKLRIRTYGANGLEAEFGDGNGSRIYQACQFPIFDVTSLHIDTEWNYGSTELISSSDYAINKDNGWLITAPGADIFSAGLRTVKLVYTAGFGTFNIIDDQNNYIDFEEAANTEISTSITAGIYTPDTLATAIIAALNAAKSGDATYSGGYNWATSKFTFNSDGGTGDDQEFNLLWNTGTNAHRSIGVITGFDVSADDDNAADATIVQIADFSVLGIPDALERATNLLVYRAFNDTPALHKDSRFDIVEERVEGSYAGSQIYRGHPMPSEVIDLLEAFIRLI